MLGYITSQFLSKDFFTCNFTKQGVHRDSSLLCSRFLCLNGTDTTNGCKGGYRSGPWTRSTGVVHGPGVHVLYTSEAAILSLAARRPFQMAFPFTNIVNEKCSKTFNLRNTKMSWRSATRSIKWSSTYFENYVGFT